VAGSKAGKIDGAWLAVGFVVPLAITACGISASLAPPMTETPSAQVGTDTATSVLAPSATQRPQPTLTPVPTPSVTPIALSPTSNVQPEGVTRAATLTPISTHTPTPSPAASATPMPSLPMPTETLAPPPVVPTPALDAGGTSQTEQAVHRFLPLGSAQPDLSQPCPGCPRAPGYIVGRVVDAGGHPLAGVRLVCYNDWHRYPVVGSKGSGEYDFPILQAEATWYVVILDEADRPASPEAPVHFNPLEACWYRLDWQRID
jgi:hypothetical protein